MDLEVVYGDDWNAIAHAFEYGNRQVTLTLLDATSWHHEAKIGPAKARPDGQWVDLIGSMVSAVFAGSLYVQEDDRTSGIKIPGAANVAIGDRVRVHGELGTVHGERVLQNAVVDKLTGVSPH